MCCNPHAIPARLRRIPPDPGGPEDPQLVEKLAALVPPPRFNLVRYHGVVAADSRRDPPTAGHPSDSPVSRHPDPCTTLGEMFRTRLVTPTRYVCPVGPRSARASSQVGMGGCWRRPAGLCSALERPASVSAELPLKERSTILGINMGQGLWVRDCGIVWPNNTDQVFCSIRGQWRDIDRKSRSVVRSGSS